MTTGIALLMLACGALACGAVPFDAAHWENASPLGGDFTNGTYVCSYRGCQWNMPVRDVSVSTNTVISASFAPGGADGISSAMRLADGRCARNTGRLRSGLGHWDVVSLVALWAKNGKDKRIW